MKPKILHIGKYYFPFKGGIEKVVQDICENLKDEFEFTVLVSNTGRNTKIDNIKGIKVIRIPTWFKISNMPFSTGFSNWIKNLEFDLIHVHMPTPLAELSCLFSNTDKKIIASFHYEMYKKGSSFYIPFQKNFLKKTFKIIVATKNHFKYSNVLSDFRDKIEIIPYGIDEKKFIKHEGYSNPYSGTQNQFNILYVGRFTEYKGIDYLIESMKYLDNEVKLYLVGTGKLKNQLHLLVQNLDLQERVIFKENINDDTLLDYYKFCDVFVLPSIDVGEAFGLVQLEAMASGKPVINTDLKSGVPLVSINNETGITVPPRDSKAIAEAIFKLKTNKKLSNKFGENGIKRILEYFTIDKMKENYHKLYKSVL